MVLLMLTHEADLLYAHNFNSQLEILQQDTLTYKAQTLHVPHAVQHRIRLGKCQTLHWI